MAVYGIPSGGRRHLDPTEAAKLGPGRARVGARVPVGRDSRRCGRAAALGPWPLAAREKNSL